MDHQNHPLAAFATIISLFSGGLAMITIKDVQSWVSITAGCIAIISGIFAIRYYHHSTKKLKKENS